MSAENDHIPDDDSRFDTPSYDLCETCDHIRLIHVSMPGDHLFEEARVPAPANWRDHARACGWSVTADGKWWTHADDATLWQASDRVGHGFVFVPGHGEAGGFWEDAAFVTVAP